MCFMGTKRGLIAPLLAVLLLPGCNGGQEKSNVVNKGKTNKSGTGKVAANGGTHNTKIAQIAREIATDVGTVQTSRQTGSLGPVFVFEEYHTSRIGQHQIAIMLLRLHKKHGLRQIGLEGAIQSKSPIDMRWFRRLGGPDAQATREDVALRMLGEGEISAAEFISLVFNDVQVHGLERKEEYDQKLDTEGNPAATYLLKIAQKKLTQADIRKINELAAEGKQKEAVEHMMKADPWVRKQLDAMKDRKKVLSLVDSARRMREIRDKARELGVQVDQKTKDGLEQTLQFFKMASKRSSTMTKHMAKLLTAGSKPSAMIIGAAHSEEVKQLLEQSGVSYALVRPLALNPKNGNLSLKQFERKNANKWARTAPGTLGAVLNTNRKPSPILETTTGKSYASGLFASQVLAEAVRGGKNIPDDVRGQLANLPECRVDFDSIKIDGFDVTFSMKLRDTRGRERQVWVRAGTTGRDEPVKSLEGKLHQQIADLGGGGGKNDVPPRDPPNDSKTTGDKEGPGDGKKAGVVVARLSPRAVAVFGKDLQDVNKVGRISG